MTWGLAKGMQDSLYTTLTCRRSRAPPGMVARSPMSPFQRRLVRRSRLSQMSAATTAHRHAHTHAATTPRIAGLEKYTQPWSLLVV